MYFYSLRQLREYDLAFDDGRTVKLDSLRFDEPDEVECHVTHLGVRRPGVQNKSLALIPTGRIVSIDDGRRQIRSSMRWRELLRATCDAGTARGRPGRNFYFSTELLGCRVSARDGDTGIIVDMLIDTHHWDLRYFELDIGRREVLVDPAWTSSIEPREHSVALDLPLMAIADAPEFNESTVINPGYCEALYRHYTSRQYMH